MENYKQNRLVKIAENEYIKDFLLKNNLSNSFVMDNFGVFDNCLSSLELCKNCKGLLTCGQAKRGEKVGLEIDPILNNNVSYCDYYKAYAAKEKLIKSYVYSDIPDNLYSLTLDNIKCEEPGSLNLLQGLKLILEEKRNRGLYIHGDLGVGKTYLCIALCNSLVLKGRKVSFIKTNNFVSTMANLNRTNPESYMDYLEKIKRSDVLVLDDIGSEIVTEFVRDRLFIDLLDYRMENKLTTIFTSNLDKNSLLKHYGGNETSMKARRLLERVDILSLDYCLKGTNKRRLGL